MPALLKQFFVAPPPLGALEAFFGRGRVRKSRKTGKNGQNFAAFSRAGRALWKLDIFALRRGEKDEGRGKNRKALAAPVLAQFRFEN